MIVTIFSGYSSEMYRCAYYSSLWAFCPAKWFSNIFSHFSRCTDIDVQALRSCLYSSHVPQQAKLSPRPFGAYSANDSLRILLKLLADMGFKFSAAFASFIFGSWSFHQNADGSTIAGTLSPEFSVLVLFGILSASSPFITLTVAVACIVCIRGFLDPKFP